MKLSQEKKDVVTELRVKATAAQGARAGDTIEVGVSHNIKIKGDEAWVSFKSSTVIGGEETEYDATNRLIDFVNNGVMRAIEDTVNTVNKQYEK